MNLGQANKIKSKPFFENLKLAGYKPNEDDLMDILGCVRRHAKNLHMGLISPKPYEKRALLNYYGVTPYFTTKNGGEQ